MKLRNKIKRRLKKFRVKSRLSSKNRPLVVDLLVVFFLFFLVSIKFDLYEISREADYQAERIDNILIVARDSRIDIIKNECGVEDGETSYRDNVNNSDRVDACVKLQIDKICGPYYKQCLKAHPDRAHCKNKATECIAHYIKICRQRVQ